MKNLKELLAELEKYEIHGNDQQLVSGIFFDSRSIKKNNDTEAVPLYVAQRGAHADGHQFIDQAIDNGARVIVCEHLPVITEAHVCYVVVFDASLALGYIADAFYDHPSRELKLVGITGTNGKTTTVTILYKLFTKMGYPVGMISTIENKINNFIIPATHTTPNAVELNDILHQMVDAGCEYCFMEVSSHAICQQRIAGLTFTGAIFSNITHDHLDFHKTFDNYIEAKKQFFDHLSPHAFALTNIDDRNGIKMVEKTKAQIYKYSLQTMADFKGKIIDDSFDGLLLAINEREAHYKLCGKFNAYNLLSVYGTAILLKADPDEILTALSSLEGASGRFQSVHNNRGCTAIVDYAHTPDALKNVLTTIQHITKQSVEIITVVGCGGDRDTTKRPEMAEIACQYSNKVILTSDNSRSEEPATILQEMYQGVPKPFERNVLVVENRHEAIKTACMLLKDYGVLLVAGKGHETYQETKGVRIHFDDMEEIQKYF